jgi:hypothetical protein
MFDRMSDGQERRGSRPAPAQSVDADAARAGEDPQPEYREPIAGCQIRMLGRNWNAVDAGDFARQQTGVPAVLSEAVIREPHSFSAACR